MVRNITHKYGKSTLRLAVCSLCFSLSVEVSVLAWVVFNSFIGAWDALVFRVEIANAIFYLGCGMAILITVDVIQFCLICGCMRRKIRELSEFKSVINLNRESLADMLLSVSGIHQRQHQHQHQQQTHKTHKKRHRTAITAKESKITKNWKIYEIDNPCLAYLVCYNTDRSKSSTIKELLI